MNLATDLLPVKVSELTIGKPLSWDLFNKDHKQLLARGDVINTADELQVLEKSPVFRLQEAHSKPSTTEEEPSEFRFEDMNLSVGDKFQLKLPTSIRGELSTAELIGYVLNTTLIISMPQSTQLPEPSLIEGDQITIRLFSRKYAFSFIVYVEKLIKIPFKYIHLSFPTNISGQLIRKSLRIKTEIVATIPDHPVPAIISNLSITGAEIRTSSSLGKLGETITLSFTVEIHGIEKSLSLKAAIRSTKQATKSIDNTLYFGIEFQELPTEHRFALQSLIYQELVDRPRSHA